MGQITDWLTFTAVVVGVLALAVAWRQTQATMESLKDQLEPYVFVDIKSDEHQPGLAVITVENTGKSVATSVTVAFERNIEDKDGNSFDCLTLKSLTPGKVYVRIIGHASKFMASQQVGNWYNMNVRVEYSGRYAKDKHRLEYGIDLHALTYVPIGHNTFHNAVEELKKLNKSVASISSNGINTFPQG